MKKFILIFIFFFILVSYLNAEPNDWNQFLYDSIHFAENGNDVTVDIENIELALTNGEKKLSKRDEVQIRFIEAARHGKLWDLYEQVEKGAKVNRKYHYQGKSALISALDGLYDIETYIKVMYLLDLGADVNLKGKGLFGITTPLHVAIYNSTFLYKRNLNKSYTEYDFRKTRWGMTKEEVMARETAKIILERKYDLSDFTTASIIKSNGYNEVIGYADKIVGLNVKIAYCFLNGSLVKISCYFIDKYEDKSYFIAAYDSLLEMLAQKYGAPVYEGRDLRNDKYKDSPHIALDLGKPGDLKYYAMWETATTEISLHLLKNDYDEVVLTIDYTNTGYTKANKRYAEQILQELIKKGAFVSAKDEKGKTPLHAAAEHNHLYAAQLLFESDSKVMPKDNSGKTPLDYAGSAEMIKLLKKYGAKEY